VFNVEISKYLNDGRGGVPMIKGRVAI
jgi:hypothetical protein